MIIICIDNLNFKNNNTNWMGMGVGFGDEEDSPHYSFVRNFGNLNERSPKFKLNSEYRINSASTNIRGLANPHSRENVF